MNVGVLGLAAVLLAIAAQGWLGRITEGRPVYFDDAWWVMGGAGLFLAVAMPLGGKPRHPGRHRVALLLSLLALIALIVAGQSWLRYPQMLYTPEMIRGAAAAVLLLVLALLVDNPLPEVAGPAWRDWWRRFQAGPLLRRWALPVTLACLPALVAISYWWRKTLSTDAALLWIISTLLLIWVVYRAQGFSWQWPRLRRDEYGIALGVLLALGVAIFLRFYQLADLPYGSWYDEAESGLEAVEILKGREFSPMAKFTFNPSLFFYAIALSFRVFGISIIGVRVITAVAGVLTVLFLYLLMKELFHRKIALMAAFFLAVLSWHVTFSRIGMQNVLAPLFATITGYFFFQGLRRRQASDFLWAGLFMGWGVYSYTPGRLVPAILAAIIAHQTLSRRGFLKAHFGNFVLLGIAALIALAPLGVFAIQNTQEFTARSNQTSVFAGKNTDQEKRAALENSLRRHLLMFNVRGDGNGRHGLPGRPMADEITGPLFVAGIVYCLYHWRRPEASFLLVWLAVGMVGGVFSLDWEAPQGARSILTTPVLAALAAVPVGQVWERLSQRGRMATGLAGIAVLCLFALLTKINYDRYFVYQMNNPQVFYDHSARETAQARYINQLGPNWIIYFQNRDAPIVRLIANRPEDFRFFMPIDNLPIKEQVKKDVAVLYEPWRVALTPADFLRYYPAAQIEMFPDIKGDVLFYAVRIQRDDVLAIQGLTGNYYPNLEWNGTPVLTRLETEIALNWRQERPLAGDFSVEWTGSLYVPQASDYRLALRGAPRAAIYLDDNLVAGDPVRGIGDAVMALSLAKGLHNLRLRVAVPAGESPEVRLVWALPGGEEGPVPRGNLCALSLPTQGLLARYYRGPNWQGPAVLQSVDSLMSFRWHPAPMDGQWSAEWRGVLSAPATGQYTFSIITNDRVWMTIDGKPLLESAQNGTSAQVNLTAGDHDVVIRYADTRGYSEFRLFWSTPGKPERVTVPPEVWRVRK